MAATTKYLSFEIRAQLSADDEAAEGRQHGSTLEIASPGATLFFFSNCRLWLVKGSPSDAGQGEKFSERSQWPMPTSHDSIAFLNRLDGKLETWIYRDDMEDWFLSDELSPTAGGEASGAENETVLADVGDLDDPEAITFEEVDQLLYQEESVAEEAYEIEDAGYEATDQAFSEADEY